MGLFSKKKTTVINQTGLGDEQMDTLTTNQANIGTSLDQGFAGVDSTLGYGTTGGTVAGDLDTLQTTADATAGDVSGIRNELGYEGSTSSVRSDLAGLGSDISGVGSDVTGVRSDLGYEGSGTDLRTDITGISADVNTTNQNLLDSLYGVDDGAGQRVTDTMEAGGVTGMLDTGFATVGEGITGLESDISSVGGNVENIKSTLGFEEGADTTVRSELEGLAAGQDTLGTTIGESETAIIGSVDEAKDEVLTSLGLEGEETVGGLIRQFGEANTEKLMQLLTGQENIMAVVGEGGIQTTLNNLVADYTEDVTLANQTRGELKANIAGLKEDIMATLSNAETAREQQTRELAGRIGDVETDVAAVTSDVDTGFSDAALALSGLSRDVGGVSSDVDEFAEDAAVSFGEVATAIATGQDITTAEAQEVRDNFVENLGVAKNVLLDATIDVDDDVRASYTALSESFDENGRLISSDVTDIGTRIERALTDQGDLFIAEFDQNDAQIGQVILDLDDMMAEIDEYQLEEAGRLEQGFSDLTQRLDQQGDSFASRFDTLDEGQLAQQQDFVDRLDALDVILGDTDINIQDGMREQLRALNSAFDDTGKLITRSLDENGNILSRTIDQQGQLVLGIYSRINGALLDRAELDINRLMASINDLRRVVGTNAQSSNRSAPADAPFAPTYDTTSSPFTIRS